MLKKLIGTINSRMASLFIYSNLLAMLFVFVFPAVAQDEQTGLLLTLNSLFVFGVLIVAILVYKIFSSFRRPVQVEESVHEQLLSRNITLLTVLPLLGIFLIFFDRVYVRGISYSQGLRFARYEWMETAGGSLFGVIGNLLVPFAYVAVFVLVRQRNKLRGRQYYFLIFSTIIGIFGHAALNGGRSNLLLAAVMVLIAMVLRRSNEFIRIFKFRNLVHLIVLLFGLYYVFYIMASSASLGDVDMAFIAQYGISDMYGVPDQNFFSGNHSNIVYALLYSLAYLYHGQWTTQIALDMAVRPGFHSLISSPTVMLNNWGIIDLGLKDRAFADTGAFISLPGAVYYDFGWIGVISCVAILGTLFGLSMFIVTYSSKLGVMKTILLITVLYVLILSPVLPAYGFAYFPFIIMAFLFMAIFNRVFFKRKTYF